MDVVSKNLLTRLLSVKFVRPILLRWKRFEGFHALVPDCKIICTFRDPVHRAYSNYKLMRRMGLTNRSLEESLAVENGNWESNRYGFYLRKWRNRFSDGRLLVTLFDDLINEPQAYLDEICNFIGANQVVLADQRFPSTARNEIEHEPTVTSVYLARSVRIVRSWIEEHEATWILEFLKGRRFSRYLDERGGPFPTLDVELENRLRDRFRPEVEALEELIGRDLSVWKQPRFNDDGLDTSADRG